MFGVTRYCLQMYFKILETCVLKYKLNPDHFLSVPGLAWPARSKKTGVKLKLLTDLDMLLMVEREIRGGICHAIHRYAKENSK